MVSQIKNYFQFEPNIFFSLSVVSVVPHDSGVAGPRTDCDTNVHLAVS